jgi:hypothetical protein
MEASTHNYLMESIIIRGPLWVKSGLLLGGYRTSAFGRLADIIWATPNVRI